MLYRYVLYRQSYGTKHTNHKEYRNHYNMYVCDLLQVFVCAWGHEHMCVCALLFLAEVAETALLRLRRGFIPLEGCRLSSSCSVK